MVNQVLGNKNEVFKAITLLKCVMLLTLTCRNLNNEACSTIRALRVLSSAFSLNTSARQGACKRSRFKSIGVSPENPGGYQNYNGFS